ncbi:bifunctional ADP-heptose synthase [Chitinophagales bacterium]|nr:bifunctional ADP-heptose synthase [Chitinophagales bacterium]
MINPGDFQKDAFSDLQILVVGDAMIDRYYYGRIERQSPEADVPIVDIQETENRLGGAANVAVNIAKLGAKAHLMTVIGDDEDGALFQQLLEGEGISHNLVKTAKPTTVKTRIYSANNYVLRYDIEDRVAITEDVKKDLLESIERVFKTVPLSAIILQDYNKGVFTTSCIRAIIDLAKQANIPVIVDPKEDNFFAYQGVDLFKPNLKEVNKALNTSYTGDMDNALKEACHTLRERNACKAVLLTLAQHGAVAQDASGFYKVDAHKRNVVDVSGAGDTVVAMAALLLGLHFPLPKLLFYSNLAGGLVIESRGVKALDYEHWMQAIHGEL